MSVPNMLRVVCGSQQREEMEEAVVGLWLEYAQFEKRLRQFKQVWGASVLSGVHGA